MPVNTNPQRTKHRSTAENKKHRPIVRNAHYECHRSWSRIMSAMLQLDGIQAHKHVVAPHPACFISRTQLYCVPVRECTGRGQVRGFVVTPRRASHIQPVDLSSPERKTDAITVTPTAITTFYHTPYFVLVTVAIDSIHRHHQPENASKALQGPNTTQRRIAISV